MLNPGKITVFVLFSILIHVTFAILFAKVTLSFTPPAVKELSLAILTREGGQGEIVQSKAAWPMPQRIEPGFSAEDVLESFDAEIEGWTQFSLPSTAYFSPKESLISHIKIAELADEAYGGTPEELSSPISPESKPMPLITFALGPAVPEIFESD